MTIGHTMSAEFYFRNNIGITTRKDDEPFVHPEEYRRRILLHSARDEYHRLVDMRRSWLENMMPDARMQTLHGAMSANRLYCISLIHSIRRIRETIENAAWGHEEACAWVDTHYGEL